MATPPPDDPNPKARLEPTRPATLAVAALAAMALSWIGISAFWNELPTLPWLLPLTLVGLAVYEAAEALGTKNRIDRKRGAGPVRPLIGALFGGLYLGVTAWLLTQRGVLAQVADNLPQALLGTAGSILLVAAALWLE